MIMKQQKQILGKESTILVIMAKNVREGDVLVRTFNQPLLI